MRNFGRKYFLHPQVYVYIFMYFYFESVNPGADPDPSLSFYPVIMAVCNLFRLLLSTDLITVHLLLCIDHTVIKSCYLSSLERITAIRYIVGMLRHMQDLYCLDLRCGYLHRRVTGHCISKVSHL